MTPHEHACFQMGAWAGLGLGLFVTAIFGWLFIAYVEGWTPGRLIAGRRNRR